MKDRNIDLVVMAVSLSWLASVYAEVGTSDAGNGGKHYSDLERAYFSDGLKSRPEGYAVQDPMKTTDDDPASWKVPLDKHYNVLEYEYFTGTGFESERKK